MLNVSQFDPSLAEGILVFQEVQYQLFRIAPPELAHLKRFDIALNEAVNRELLRRKYAGEEGLWSLCERGLDLPLTEDNEGEDLAATA
jgi:hypothetical protein